MLKQMLNLGEPKTRSSQLIDAFHPVTSTFFQARTDMTTLHITDLSINKELDAKSMTAVRGGAGPTNIQSDNTFHQDATNTNTATNVDAFVLLGRLGPFRR